MARAGLEEPYKRRVRCKMTDEHFDKLDDLVRAWRTKGKGEAIRRMIVAMHEDTFEETPPPVLIERVPEADKRRVGCELDEESFQMWSELMQHSRRLQGADLEYMIEHFYREEFPE